MVSVWWVLGSYALLAAGIAACAWLFLSQQSQLARLASRNASLEEQLTKGLEKQQEEAQGLQAQVKEVLKKREPLPEPGGPTLSGARRSLVMRMVRAGHPAERIAESLQVPHGEVRLLLKMQRLTNLDPAGVGTAGTR